MDTQPPLLRFLETRRYFRVGGTRELSTDVRIVAATNRKPASAVRENRLREDLYYRLAAFPIELSPLRERGDDVVELAELFLQRLNMPRAPRSAFPRLAGCSAASRLAGNVRELKHAVECAFILGNASWTLARRWVLRRPARTHTSAATTWATRSACALVRDWWTSNAG